jgi:hypothetical protein
MPRKFKSSNEITRRKSSKLSDAIDLHLQTLTPPTILDQSPTMLLFLLSSCLLLPLALCKGPTLNLVLPATSALPNPSILPPSTQALLSSSSSHLTAPLSSSNSFSFRNLSSGSYTLDIACLTYTFPFYRVDVSDAGVIEVWQMFRTQGWAARGPRVGGGSRHDDDEITVSIGVLGQKEFYETRAGCELISLFYFLMSYLVPLEESSSLRKEKTLTLLPSLLHHSLTIKPAQKPHDPNGRSFPLPGRRHAVSHRQQ